MQQLLLDSALCMKLELVITTTLATVGKQSASTTHLRPLRSEIQIERRATERRVAAASAERHLVARLRARASEAAAGIADSGTGSPSTAARPAGVAGEEVGLPRFFVVFKERRSEHAMHL